MDLFLIGLLALFAGGAAAATFPRRAGRLSFLLAAPAGCLLLGASSLGILLSAGPGFSFSLPVFFLNEMIEFSLDSLGAFFILIISASGLFGSLYSLGHIRKAEDGRWEDGTHFFLISLLIISMSMLVLSGNAFAFLFFWEAMSLSSFLLVVHERGNEDAVRAGTSYLAAMQVGVAFLFAGFAYLYSKTGSLNFAYFAPALKAAPSLGSMAFILFFVGFAFKAGFFPFHTWLPEAHPAAPSNVSALMSGVMIKTGIYGILRMYSLGAAPSLGFSYAVLAISLLTALFGIANAQAERDVKRMLAYSSMENIGIIGIGMGMGFIGKNLNLPLVSQAGFAGALLHTLNHSLFKGMLFESFGVVYRQAHSRIADDYGGVIKKSPLAGAAFLFASAAICALPPLAGFAGEFLIYMALIRALGSGNALLGPAAAVSVGLLALIGALTLLSFSKASGIVFLGSPRREFRSGEGKAQGPIKEGSLLESIPLILQACLVLLIGLLPAAFVWMLAPPLGILLGRGGSPGLVKGLFEILIPLSRAFAAFGIIALFLFLLRALLLRDKKRRTARTWDCGYRGGSPRMQYTARSFSGPALPILRPFLSSSAKIHDPEGPFPEKASFGEKLEDPVDKTLITPMMKAVRKFLDLFAWIQSGDTQRYILYGIIFLLAILAWVMGAAR